MDSAQPRGLDGGLREILEHDRLTLAQDRGWKSGRASHGAFGKAGLAAVARRLLGAMLHRHCGTGMLVLAREDRGHAERHQKHGNQEEEPAEHHASRSRSLK
jgi:hypothetical protein